MNNIVLDVNGKFKMHGDGVYTLDNMFDTLKISVTENEFRTPKDLTLYTAKMAYVDKDKAGDIVDVTIKNAENGEIEFAIDNRFTAIPGVKYCQILLIKGEEKKHLAVFKLEVRDGVFLNAYEEAYKDKKFEEFLNSIDKIDELLSKTEASDNQIKKLSDKTSELESIANKNKADIEIANSNHSALAERVDAAENDINKNKSDIEIANTNYKTITNKVTEIENNITKNENDIASNSQNISNLRTEISKVDNKSSENAESIKELYSLISDGDNGNLSGIAEKVEKNSKELNLLRRNFPTAEDRLISDIEKVSRKTESTLATFEDYNPVARNTIGGIAPYYEINGECTENIIEFLEEWDNQGSYAFRKIAYDRIQPNSKYTLVLIDAPNKLEKVNLGAYGVDRYLPDIEGVICKFTTPASIYQLDTYVRIYCRSGESFTSEDLKEIKVMLIKGHINYYPEYFEGVNWIGKSDSKLKMITNNKNLCPLIKIQNSNNASYSVDWNIVNIEPENLGRTIESSVTTEVITLKPNRTYTVSYTGNSNAFKMEIYNSVKAEKINNTFTTSERDFGIKLKLYCNSSESGNKATFLIQIEEDSKQSVFEKPLMENIEIDLGENIGLMGVPAIKDKLNPTEIQLNTGYLKIEETGWEQADDYGQCLCFNNLKYKAPLLPLQKDGEMLSNKFEFIWAWGDYRHIHTNADLGLCITIPKKLLSSPDVRGFEKWLQANEVYIIYRLAKPVTIPLDNSPVISSYNKYSSLKIDDKSSSLASIKYYTDNSNQVSEFSEDFRGLKTENMILKRAVKTAVESMINLFGIDIEYYEDDLKNRSGEYENIENLKSILNILNN